MSQEELAGTAEVSARHVSCLERGIAAPSEAMVLRLAEALDLPLRERNGLLGAAGFAQRWHDAGEAIPLSLQPAVDLLLKNQPLPAYALSGQYTVLQANDAGWILLRMLTEDAAPGMNVARALFARGPHRDLIENYPAAAKLFLVRLRAEALHQGPQSPLWPIIGEAQRDPLIRDSVIDPASEADPVFPLTINAFGQRSSWITVLLSFGSAMDAMVEQLTIEQFLPADEETAAFARDWLSQP